VLGRIRVDGLVGRESNWVALSDGSRVAAMGRIAGDERWLVGQSPRMEIVVLHF
jgi:hypothetical protein